MDGVVRGRVVGDMYLFTMFERESTHIRRGLAYAVAWTRWSCARVCVYVFSFRMKNVFFYSAISMSEP